jgi:hypothetical protein
MSPLIALHGSLSRLEHEANGVHRPGADLGIVRLPDHAAALGPVVLQLEDDVLEGGFGHFVFDSSGFDLSEQIIPYRFCILALEYSNNGGG